MCSLFPIKIGSLFTQAWRMMGILCALTSAFLSCFKASMLDSEIQLNSPYLKYPNIVLETFFGLDMMITCLTEILDPLTLKAERRINKIIGTYLKSNFALDLLAIFPFFIVCSSFSSNFTLLRLVFLIKLLRMKRALMILNKKTFLKQVKKYFWDRMHRLIETN
jgi:hypothetical protein